MDIRVTFELSGLINIKKIFKIIKCNLPFIIQSIKFAIYSPFSIYEHKKPQLIPQSQIF